MAFEDVLALVGGLCLFLFGMQVMGHGLEKSAGSRLGGVIGRLTTRKWAGLLTGLAVTAVIQSSSATTVMVVGFVNSGVMRLSQAIHVIMGANVGTTVTSWILSLTGIDSSNIWVSLLKPSSFTPLLALVGIVLLLAGQSDKKKDVGSILLGFATLMFGMDTMSAAVAGLSEVEAFRSILLMFSHPVLGVLAGAVLTAVIQSSSASVGILQALSSTGQVTVGTAIPIILGQNIGTCITAMLSSIGASRNARRAAVVHLVFNVLGCVLWLGLYSLANALFRFSFVHLPANGFSIALVHTLFNVACTVSLFPFSRLLEKLACRLVPDKPAQEEVQPLLDPRLLSVPAFAIDSCRKASFHMAETAVRAMELSLAMLEGFGVQQAQQVRMLEDETDRLEDEIGSYLVLLSAKPLNREDSQEATKILHMIGDFERIADHAVNLVESAEEMAQKRFSFSPAAGQELSVLLDAVRDILRRTCCAYLENDIQAAQAIEPLEQVIDGLRAQLRARHILRLQAGECSLEAGFVLSDLLTSLERTADHCSNIAGCIIEMQYDALDLHRYLGERKQADDAFLLMYEDWKKQYSLPQG